MNVKKVDVTIDMSNSLDGALQIVQLVKPSWNVEEISFKVGKVSYASSNSQQVMHGILPDYR